MRTRRSGVNNPLDIGTNWLIEHEFLAIKVPSVIVPFEYNYVLNPKHSLFRDVEIVEVVDFHFDRRLFKTQ